MNKQQFDDLLNIYSELIGYYSLKDEIKSKEYIVNMQTLIKQYYNKKDIKEEEIYNQVKEKPILQ